MACSEMRTEVGELSRTSAARARAPSSAACLGDPVDQPVLQGLSGRDSGGP